MKTSTIILNLVLAAAIIYIVYLSYKNYQASGSIFRSSPIVVETPNPVVVYDTTNRQGVSQFVATDGKSMNGHNHSM